MIKENQIEVNNYGDMLAIVNECECIFYGEYGSYQGEYIAILLDEKNIKIYVDYFGSCSGCDWLHEADEKRFGDGSTKDFVIPYLEAVRYVSLESKAQYVLPLNLFKKLSISDFEINIKWYDGQFGIKDWEEIDKILQDKINNK